MSGLWSRKHDDGVFDDVAGDISFGWCCHPLRTQDVTASYVGFESIFRDIIVAIHNRYQSLHEVSS